MKARKLISLALSLSLALGLVGMNARAYGNPAPAADSSNVVYTVTRGDNLWKIATRNGITLPQLLSLNPQIKNPSLIYVGDQVVVGKNAAPIDTAKPADPTKPAETVSAADLVFKNGTIQTLVSENDVAQAIAIKGNTIVYVGSDQGAAAYIGANTKVVDLEGQFMSPGFMDGHLHGPQPYYEQMFQISIPDGTVDNAEYLRIIKEFVDTHPDLDVYYGGPFMQNAYLKADGSNPGPQKEDLDAICSDKPIMIRDVSHHAMWANSKALEMAGITKDTPDPDGGVIARNAKGEPSGLLTDAAKNILTAKISVDYTVENMKIAYEAFQDYCLSKGITGLSNINLSGEEMIHIDALHQMEQEGNMNLRQQFLVWGHAGMGYEGIKAKLDAVKPYESDMIKTGTVKIVYDGVTEGATAVMLEPYLSAAGRGDNWTATSDWTTEEYNKVVLALDKNGYQVHTHAIGDGAVRASLDAYELAQNTNGKRDARHTMVHVSAIADSDIQRAADLKVVCDLQFLWMYNDPLCHLESAFVGKDRAFAFYPAKKMLDAGCLISGGSDGAVTAYDPLLEIEVGVTRNSPFPGEQDTDMYRWKEQALTPYQMLEIYTKNVAYENFMEDEIGTIEVGKKADLVVLDQNILKCDPKDISESKVVYTISDGKIVYTGETVKSADLVFKNGTIQTLVNENDVAQAVAIKGNTIVYVGDDAGVAAYVGADTQVIDLEGQFMSPGFMDGHLHGPQPYFEKMFRIYIPDGTMDNAEYLRIIKEFVDANPDMDVYYGGPFMQNAYLQADGSNPGPKKEDLDAICSDKPIIIRDVSYHARWVNSKALEMAGITKDTKDPVGGVIARNADGEPSGLLIDTAMSLINNAIDLGDSQEEMVEAYRAFQDYCSSVGITGLTDINTNGEEVMQAGAVHQLDAAGELNLRTRYLVWGKASDQYEDIIGRLDAIKPYNSEMFRTGTVKTVYDGVTEGATAVMLDPYLPAAGKGANWYGESKWEDDAFNKFVAQLDKDGLQVHVHAIGDGAVRSTLDAFEYAKAQNNTPDPRFTMVHVSAIADSDITRAAKLGVVSDLQFLWMYNDPLCHLESAFVGKDKAMAFYPAKKMLDAGCIISGGSDGAVTAYNPLLEIEVGVTRNSPFPGEQDTDMYRWKEQGLTPYQMLEIYTKNVAYENFMDDEIGTIEVGKKADLVVLNQNILKCDPKDISESKVAYTVSNGRVVYTAP